MKGKVAALAGMISALLLALGLVIVAGWTSDGLTLHYLDVGKCNCVLAESPDGSFMMIDAGSNGEKDTRRILEYLKAQGVETLEYLLITHPHKDHIRAAEAVLRACPAKTVLMGDFGKDTVGSDVFESLLHHPDPGRLRPNCGRRTQRLFYRPDFGRRDASVPVLRGRGRKGGGSAARQRL